MLIGSSNVEKNNKLLARVSELVFDDNSAELKEELNKLTTLRDTINSEHNSLLKLSSEYTTKIRQYTSIVKSDGVCPFTAQKCDSFDIADIKRQLNKLSIALAELEPKTKDAEKKLRETEKRRTEINQILNDYKNKNEMRAKLESDVDVSLNNESLSNLNSEIKGYTVNELSTLVEKLIANQQYNELTEKLTKEKYKLQRQLTLLQLWVKLTGVNGLQSRLMNEPFEELADSVSSYLKRFFKDDSITAKFRLSEKVNSFDFGITTPYTNYRSFDLLSSGEKCLYTLALLLSVVELSTAPLKMIMVDDLLDHLDSEK